MLKIVLASASPRREKLLNQINLDFEIRSTALEEKKTGDPIRAVRQAALAKASTVVKECRDALVIAADTVVAVDNKILEKPRDSSEASKMLKILSGRIHRVITGLALVDSSGKQRVDHEITKVYFRELSNREISSYVESGEPMDKAGAYGIQGQGALLVERIEGCYFNVVGLPLFKLGLMMKEFGVDVFSGEV